MVSTTCRSLEPCYRELLEEVPTKPADPKHLGFEAQRILAEHLDEKYDLYVYLEDDLLIHDPLFFVRFFGSSVVLESAAC